MFASSIIDTLNLDFTETEEKIISYMKNTLEGKNNAEKIFIEQSLDQWTPGKFMRFAKNDFIRQYFETNPHVQALWKKALAEDGCPDILLQGNNPKEQITLSQSYRGKYYYGLFTDALLARKQNNDRIDLLKMACDLGSFNALRARCHINIAILNRPDTAFSSEANKLRIQQITSDTERLCNLYGAPGYLASSLILNNLGACFIPTDVKVIKSALEDELGIESKEDDLDHVNKATTASQQTNQKEYHVMRGLSYYDKARECLVVSLLLDGNEYSDHLLNVLTKGKGRAALLHKDSNWLDLSTPETGLADLKANISKDSFDSILKNAKAEKAKYLTEPAPQPSLSSSSENE